MIKLPATKETKFVYHGGNGAFECGYESGWNAAIAEVQRLNATAQPVSDGWVKCIDQMPSVGQEVLCAYKGSGHGVHIWHEHHWDEGDSDASIFGRLITHWMPLPAAPGGQDD